ncbi:unnamed protein product [Diatraea saccharalis]|uniref:XK-related protein n=1 Tax=Diatraea saccharalis TaxID=40085 RepID=A0A9N9R9Q0_9NEOP|nr:unnamed protein product [Diatraea saccharalis]
MPRAVRDLLQNDVSYDEPDRMPDKITITNLDILLYTFAIVGHFVDLGLDINVAIRYFFAKKMMEFGWTIAFILLPAFVNTAVSIRMYSQDKQQDSVSNEFTKRRCLRVIILVLQLAPILRFTDALISPAVVDVFVSGRYELVPGSVPARGEVRSTGQIQHELVRLRTADCLPLFTNM